MHVPPGLHKFFPVYYNPELKVSLDYFVLDIADGRIYTDNLFTVAIISEKNKLIGDVSFQYSNSKLLKPSESLIFQQKYFEDVKEIDGTVFNLCTGGGGTNNYMHFLFDGVSRIHLLKESGCFDQIDYFFVSSLKYDFQRDIFKLLGIDKSRCISADDVKHIKAKRVITSSFPRGTTDIIPKWAISFYRNEILPKLETNNDYPELIYVSRSDSSIRNVENEVELREYLGRKGFKTYELSKLPLLEKAKLFYKARVVISTIGAGLTNVIFCNSSTNVIEFFPSSYPLPHYADMAIKLNLKYYYLMSERPSTAKNLHQAQRDHITVNIDKLDDLLRNIIIE